MSAKVKVVNLNGSISLATVDDLKNRLLENIDDKPLVYASLSNTEDIDLSGVQLLYAARRYADLQGKEFHLTGAVPENIARRLHETGFVSRIVRDAKELESELHEFDLPTGTSSGEQEDA